MACAGGKRVVHDHAAALAGLQSALARQLVAWADTSGDDDHVEGPLLVFAKGYGCDFVVAEKALSTFAKQNLDPEALHFLNQ